MEYNSQQLNALENGFHQLLVANAGSGKTAVLVEKFYRLIAERDLNEIQRIVAITFTRKAASEMQERIVRTLNEQIEKIGNSNKNNIYKKLVLLRERISAAKIQTIHSFCQEILSEFAVNIGYNPNFSVIEDYQFLKIYQEYYDDTLEDLMEFDDNYKFIFEIISEHKFKELVKMLVDNYPLYLEVEAFYSQSDNVIMDKIIDGYIQIIKDFFYKNNDNLRSNTDLFSQKNQSNIEVLTSLLDDVETFISERDLFKIYYTLKELKSLKKKGNALYIKSILNQQDYELINNLLNELSFLVDSKTNSNSVVFFDLMRNLANFAKILYKKIENYKKRNSLITYNDMIYKVQELLKNQEILQNVADKYDYYLIDEFQDTDANQFEIFNKLAFASGNTHKFLFLVGDPKQSIYGFRNADVRVINSASKLVESMNKELIAHPQHNPKAAHHTTIKEQNYGNIELSNSYRLNVANTAFVNHIFRVLMNLPQNTGYEVNYNSLTYARENPYFTENTDMLSPYFSELHQFGAIKFLNTIVTKKEFDQEEKSNENNDDVLINDKIVENEEQEKLIEKEMDNIEEANSVSDYIKYIMNNKTKIYDVKTKSERILEFSDIAILVRKNSLINNLVKALDKNGIPFSLTGAEDFFATQEIMDIISFLRFINNPSDNYFFLATMKSYFFNLDDQTLYDIISMDLTNGDAYWSIFNNYIKHRKVENNKIIRAYSIINEIFQKKEFYTVQDLVTFILRITNYEEMFVNFSSKNIIYKNINKFRSLVNKIAASGINSIGELLFELELVQQSSEISTELDISTENAVKILTMHKAKGLEFPVVIIYHANFANNPKTRLTFYENKFPNISYNFLSQNDKTEATSPLYSFIKYRQKLIEIEEEKRLFYVAATRAKDLLIISSLLKPDKDRNYQKSMYQGFGSFYFPVLLKNSFTKGNFEIVLDIENLERDKIDINDLVDPTIDLIIYIKEELKIQLPNQKERIQKITVPLEVMKNFRYQENLDYKETKTSYEPILLLDNVNFPKQDKYISATRIQQFRKNQKEYFLKYITQFNLDYLDLLKEETIGDGLKGKERGTIIHNTIANIHNWHTLDGIILNKLRSEIEKLVNDSVANETIEDIYEEIIRVFSDEFIKSRISLILKSQFETPFYFYWDGKYVDVTLDVLFKNENNEIEIWDWKNNIIYNDVDYREKVEYYSLQMKVYCWLLSKHYPLQNKFIARLFFTRLAGKDGRWMKQLEWTKPELIEFENEIKDLSNKLYDAKSINFD